MNEAAPSSADYPAPAAPASAGRAGPVVNPDVSGAAGASGHAAGGAPIPAADRADGAVGGSKRWGRAAVVTALLLAIIGIGVGIGLAWRADQRLRTVEQEMVRRQQDSAGQSAEARLFAKQAQEGAREAAAKVALLEARVAEVALQRGQLEELMQSLLRSRDENLLVDVESTIRVAVQQSAISGSAEPLVASLRQTDERLARINQPRLEGVRRAIARDLDRVKAASVADISGLTIKLDEAIRLVDDLAAPGGAARSEASVPSKPPAARPRGAGLASPAPATSAASASASASLATTSASATLPERWAWNVNDATSRLVARVWEEVRGLVRVTRIDHPEAILLAPDQAFFLKENLKLRLLNARLALMSRQFDAVQNDLQVAQAALERYFDRTSRRTVLAADLIRQVASQARQSGALPRPDETLAAVAAAAAGR